MQTLSSHVAQDVVDLATYGANNDDKFGIMTLVGSQC